ncbi:MAG: SurA N-terminal domain-containing protein [Candidatus Eisenbacteria bacterium]|uniref:Periplasmic chaperone PpiD n=1 Tax=Eiseniibacteriota bacterium TaxID=2212470 RepID=A0A933SAL2_UNCEI|nr:SurA N-terminal domain-containing protein [Candidatus Eisenbacteria bacterium]
MLGYLRSGNKRTKAIWLIVTVATVVTFLLGFSFFGSMGHDPSNSGATGDYGSVNGEKVTADMWRSAVAVAKENYRQRFNTEPADRDMRSVEQQAWRSLVNQRLMAQEAQKSGLTISDRDVVVGMRTSPPNAVFLNPAFQTDGKFDPQKYQMALVDPRINWKPYEDQVREELPVRRLQERLMSSLKLSEGELREAFLDRFQSLSAVIVQVPPADTGRSSGSDEELKKVFERYRTRMAAPARTQLEVLSIPVEYSEAEVNAAMDISRGLFERARGGEDFAMLAMTNSEGPNANRGGVIDRWINPMELGPIGQTIAAHKPGDVIDPYREGGQVMIFKILDPARDSVAQNPPYPGAVKLAQIVTKISVTDESRRAQYEKARKVAAEARSGGLAKAATAHGLVTTKTGFFDLNNMPPSLFGAPEAGDWGVAHKKGDVSPVFAGVDEFIIVQVESQHLAGAPTFDEVKEQLRQIADVEARVEMSKARADRLATAVKGGATLEAAAAAEGLSAMPVNMSRQQPDPRLAASPEFQGALWGSQPGKVVGPFRSPGGWFMGRVTSVQTPPDSLWNNDQMKGQLTTDILSRRQRSFFDGYLTRLRTSAKVVDNRVGSSE